MRRSSLLLVLAAGLLAPRAAAQDARAQGRDAVAQAPWRADDLLALETALRDSAARARRATVRVRFEDGPRGHELQLGSGVVVSADGLVLTAAHLFDEPGRACVLTFADGREVAGESLGRNGLQDFAMLRIVEPGPWPYAQPAEADAPSVLQPLFSLGFPGDDLEQHGPILRVGNLLQEHAGWLQSSCGVMPGDSGGPLFDLAGRVVGIHSWIGIGRDRNYHIPIARYLEEWPRLVAGESWQHEELGVPFADRMSLVRAPHAPMLGLGLADGAGCAVDSVRDGSAADEAGLRAGDRIVQVGGRSLRDTRAFERWLHTQVARDEAAPLELVVARGDEELAITLDAPDPHPLRAAFRPLVARVSASVVRVRCSAKSRALGLVVGSDGWVLTKASELAGAPVCTLADGREVIGVVRAIDRESDLALLALPLTGLTPASWAPHVDLGVGRLVAAVGPDFAPPGVGVVGVAAAPVPMRHVGVHGLTLRGADGGGARVRAVRRGSPGATAGLAVDDVVLALGDEVLRDGAHLQAVLGTCAPGELLLLRVRRGREELLLELELGAPRAAQREVTNPLDWLTLSRRRDGFPLALRHDALTDARECGGPLVDRSGRVVAINVARADRTGCYAIPAERAAEVLARLFAAAHEGR